MWSVRHARRLVCLLRNLDNFHSFYRQSTVDVKASVLGTCQFSTAPEEQKEISVRQKIELRKSSVKKVKRQPYVKNFFCGIIDTDLMAFPEILDKLLVKDIEHSVQSINELYRNKVDSHKIRMDGKIPEDVLSEIKEMGLFGRLIPSEYGGLNLNYTSMLRLNEALSLDWSVFTTLAAHEFLAAQVLLVAGNAQQKVKYLPALATGKCIGAVCWSEPESGVDLNSICTTAFPAKLGKTVSVCGTKHWVTNGNIADLFIVFVKMPQKHDVKEEAVSVLLIDRNLEGVTVSTENNKNGLQGAGTSIVHFQNVEVPCENFIGEIGDGAKILLKAMEVCHLGMASFTFGALKELVGLATEHIINTVRFEKPVMSSQLIRQRLAKVATTIYAIESSAYFTAGLLDSTEDPDCGLECAVLKVLNCEGTLFCLRELIKIFGSSSLLSGHILQRYYQDAQVLESFEGPNDLARLFIALVGLHYVGQRKAEFVEKNRNPLFFPIDVFKTMWRQTRVMKNKVSYSQDVAGHLHRSLVVHGNHLEECVQKLEVLVEHVLTQHGKAVVYHQLDPITLANVVIDLYAMSAVLARSSRSYCNGMQNSEAEIRMAFAFCNEAYPRICRNYQNLVKGVNENNNEQFLRIAEKLIDWRGYYPEHPLKYNC